MSKETGDPNAAAGATRGGPPVHEAAARRDWPAYFERIEGRPPRATAVEASGAFERERGSCAGLLAADLACGSGIDAAELLRRGWRVLAIDASEEGLSRLRARPEAVEAGGRLTARAARLDRKSVV